MMPHTDAVPDLKRRRRTGVAIVAVAILLAIFVPLFPSPYPASQLHGIDFGPPLPNVTGSLVYVFCGYGGVVMPDHSYVVITQSDRAQCRNL